MRRVATVPLKEIQINVNIVFPTNLFQFKKEVKWLPIRLVFLLKINLIKVFHIEKKKKEMAKTNNGNYISLLIYMRNTFLDIKFL